MRNRLEDLEFRMTRLESRLDELAGKLGELVRSPAGPRPETLPLPADHFSLTSLAGWGRSGGSGGLVLLAGLSLLVLSGALVLRILTLREGGLPLPVGAAAGIGYGALLLVVANRKIRRGMPIDGDAFAVLAVLVVASLLAEVTLRGGVARLAAYGFLASAMLLTSLLFLRWARRVPLFVVVGAGVAVAAAIGGRPFLHPAFTGMLLLALGIGWLAFGKWGSGFALWPAGIPALLYPIALGVIGRSRAVKEVVGHDYAGPALALTLIGLFHLALVVGPAACLAVRRRPSAFATVGLVIGSPLLAFAAWLPASVLPGGPTVLGTIFVVVAGLLYAGALLGNPGEEDGAYGRLATAAFFHAVPGALLLAGTGATGGLVLSLGALLAGVGACRRPGGGLLLQAALAALAGGVLLAPFGLAPASPGSFPAGPFFVAAAGGLTLALASAMHRRSVPPAGTFAAGLESGLLLAVLATGVLEILAGTLGGLEVLAALSFPELAAAAREVWPGLQTLWLAGGGIALVLYGVSRPRREPFRVAAGLFAVAGGKLFLLDSFHLSALSFVVFVSLYGGALVGASLLYRRKRREGGSAVAPSSGTGSMEVSR